MGKNLGVKCVSKKIKKETEWIIKLRTIYPYGLNEKLTVVVGYTGAENKMMTA